MKSKSLLLPFAILFALNVWSCKKDDSSASSSSTSTTVEQTKKTISALWTFSDTNSPYKSLEFTSSGTYVIVKNTTTASSLGGGKRAMATSVSQILTGIYTITVNQIIELEGFGKVQVASIGGTISTNTAFTITTNDAPNTPVAYSVIKNELMPSSTNTDKLCASWQFVDSWSYCASCSVTTETVYVTFSKAGTYLVVRSGEVALNKWRWKEGSSETEFEFSDWEKGDVWHDGVFITFNTDGTLTIKEEDRELLLYPVNNGGSGSLQKSSVKRFSVSSLNPKVRRSNFLFK